MSANIALIGLGYWGPNLARNFATVSGGRLHTLCDARPERMVAVGRQFPGVQIRTEVEQVLADPAIDAVVIATPAPTHYRLAVAALAAGKHVLVEKPMAQTARECRELIELAERRKLVLMPGHVFLHNAAVRKVKEYLDAGLLGEVYYVYSQRLNFGIVRQDVNALWNFAPHDLSILNYWFGAAPEGVVARGYCYLQPGVEDVIFMTFDYPKGIGANVHISWLDPHKVRRITIVGSEKMVVYDDVSADARLMIYDKGVVKQMRNGPAGANGPSLGQYESFGEFQLLLRAGDVLIPKLDFVEPLKLECQHFIDCVVGKAEPFPDGRDGLAVVQALEAAQASLAREGRRVEITA
jgi:predicted dehydrogenase